MPREDRVGVDDPVQQFVTQGVEWDEVVVGFTRDPPGAVLNNPGVGDVVQLELSG